MAEKRTNSAEVSTSFVYLNGDIMCNALCDHLSDKIIKTGSTNSPHQ